VSLSISATPANTTYTMNAKGDRLMNAGTVAFTYFSDGLMTTRIANITDTATNTYTHIFRYDDAGNRAQKYADQSSTAHFKPNAEPSGIETTRLTIILLLAASVQIS
jgi:hypothetical protein